MKYQIRKSDDGKFFYALSIDAQHNEKCVGTSEDLKKLKATLKLPDDLEVVEEKDTRGIIDDPTAHIGELVDKGA